VSELALKMSLKYAKFMLNCANLPMTLIFLPHLVVSKVYTATSWY